MPKKTYKANIKIKGKGYSGKIVKSRKGINVSIKEKKQKSVFDDIF